MDDHEKIAIIGMSGAFPGATNISDLWDMLLEKREGLSTLPREEILAAGESPEDIENPDYVPRGGFLETAETFDESFFGLTPGEALVTDPQQRLFLEHSWLALSDAGLAPGAIDVPVGVFAGEGITQYWFMLQGGPVPRSSENTRFIVGNEKDFLATRTSYKLNLRGPSLNVQSACSTSLAAVTLACQSLLTWGCDLALAGGVMVSAPRRRGYLYREGMILSKAGYCRPFDRRADGTLFGEGVGVVCLKRLSEAVDDDDYIYAVIDSAAINNDGSDKVGYTAPSVSGQAEVVEMAHVMADVGPEGIGYIEAHGTGTYLGDPIEINALKRVFGTKRREGRPCYVGSLKANIGHLDVAAGIASLIKAVLIVNTGSIPPQLNYDEANPDLDLDGSPFAINKEMVSWEDGDRRIAGVSSFGFGGTNVHVIVESPPARRSRRGSKDPSVLLLSAKSPSALDGRRKTLAAYLERHPELNPGHVAFKVTRPRHDFAYRWGSAATNREQLLRELVEPSEARSVAAKPGCAFLFPGQGSQFAAMAKAYYGALPRFTEWIDKGLAKAEDLGHPEFRSLLLDEAGGKTVDETETTQPLLFIVEYALAQELLSRGVEPSAVAGHSIGEYAAAAIAGVLGYEETLWLVGRRGYWMQRAPRGAMTAVSLPLDKAEAYARDGVSVSVVNAENQTVLSGRVEDIEALEAKLAIEKVRFIRLRTSHAYHSPLMEGVLEEFGNDARKLSFRKAEIPFLSNVDGRWRGDAVDWASYWMLQLRQTVRFDLCLSALSEQGELLLLEVGPGKALSGFAGAYGPMPMDSVPLLPNASIESTYFEQRLINAWGKGIPVRFEKAEEVPPSLALPPGYQFDRKKFWPEGSSKQSSQTAPSLEPGGVLERSDDNRTPLPIRERVYAAWKKTIGLSPPDPSTDFFESGGDSLMAIQLVQTVKSACGVGLSLAVFLEKPTPDGLVAAVDSLVSAKEAGIEDLSSMAILPREDRRFSPLAPQQERLWFLHELEPSKPFYNLVHVVRIEGPHDVLRLSRALGKFFARHDLFRARIDASAKSPRLEFGEVAKVPVERLDLAGMSRDKAELELADFLRKGTRRAVDFSAYPVCRCTVALLPGDACAVCLFVPHIFSDGWSSEVFLNELWDSYVRAADATCAPAPLFVDFGDYAAWESSRSVRAKSSGTIAEFWKEYLQGIPAVHDLPLDFPRPKEISGLGSTLLFRLDPQLSGMVRAVCEAHSVTPNMFFLACLAFLLAKCSSQETVVVGTPYANREADEVRDMFGYFIRTIPLRFDVDGSMDSVAWLKYVKRQFLSAWERSAIGLDELVDLLGVPRVTNINPIYQVLFAYQSYLTRSGPSSGEGLPRFTQAFPDRGVSENDLALYMWETDRFEGAIEYSTDIFGPDSIDALLGNFLRIVRALAGKSSSPLRKLDLMDEAGREILARANGTDEPAFLGRTFLELFDDALGNFRGSPAVAADGVVLTYGELDALSDRVARDIVDAGAKSGERVGVYLKRDRCLLPSLIGVLKAGCAYVPLDPKFPEERLRSIISDAGIRYLVASASLAGDANKLGSDLRIMIARSPSDAGAKSGSVDLPIVDPRQTAYILFTSGSTGKPKGVPIRHDALANFLLSMRTKPGMSKDDAVLALTTTTFDISTLELFLPLVCGARVVLADDECSLDDERVAVLIESEGVTFAQATPSRWSLLLEAGWKPKPGMTLLTGGEALPPHLAKRMSETGAAVWNMYGPTETTVWSSLARIESGGAIPSIGGPIANTGLIVIDGDGRILPPGIPGELGIYGAGLSEGYLNGPDITAERFVEIDDGSIRRRVYKTGDRVRQTVAGEFYYLGRTDFQVKIRGFRIELGEIESTLLESLGIKEAVCAVWIRSDEDKRIIAYYRADAPLDEMSLRDFMKTRLPDYMVPGYFLYLEQFPKTSSGKVDRKGLPLPGDSAPSSGSGGNIAPENAIHERMGKIWRELLGREEVGVSDNFFDLGGHSMLAVSLVRSLNAEFGAHWRLRDLFDAPTIEGLAKLLDAKAWTRMPLLFPAKREGEGSPFFLVAGVYSSRYFEDESHSIYETDFLRYFSNILPIIGAGRPVYGLRPKGIYLGEHFHTTVEAMVEEYVQEIKAIQPTGPYLIGGECLGGNIAHAIACRLRSRGEQVAKLVLFDTYRMRLWNELYARAYNALKNAKDSFAGIGHYCMHPDLRMSTLAKSWRRARIILLPFTKKDREKRRLERGAMQFSKLLLHYRPSEYKGTTLLIANEVWNAKDPSLYWDAALCPNLDIRVVPGDHTTRLKQGGEYLAKVVEESLERSIR